MFRSECYLRKLISVPLAERRATLRSGNGEGLSIETRKYAFACLEFLRVEVSHPEGGKMNIRGELGCVFRWCHPWLGAIWDGFEGCEAGLGWSFEKHDRLAIDQRVDVLIDFSGSFTTLKFCIARPGTGPR